MGRPDKQRSSQWRCSVKKGVLKNSANFKGNHLCWSFFSKVAANQAYNFTKIIPQHRCFPVKFAKNFKNTYFEEHLPTDASINKRQRESHALSRKKNEYNLLSLSHGQ